MARQSREAAALRSPRESEDDIAALMRRCMRTVARAHRLVDEARTLCAQHAHPSRAELPSRALPHWSPEGALDSARDGFREAVRRYADVHRHAGAPAERALVRLHDELHGALPAGVPPDTRTPLLEDAVRHLLEVYFAPH